MSEHPEGTDTNQLKTLQDTRRRLEAALADDEYWRALMHSAAEADGHDAAARQARNARLEMALAANPLYRSWKQVTAAIAAITEGGNADAALLDNPNAFALPLHEGASDLPEDIADLIRRGAGEQLPVLPSSSPQPADRSELPAPSAAPADQAATATASPAQKPAEIAQVSVADAARRVAPVAPRRHPAVEGDASVTFVRREPRPSLLPSAELPPDLGIGRKSALFERLRSVVIQNGNGEETPNAYAAPSSDASEADVVIVTPEAKREQQLKQERAGTVRRFLKALSGG